MIHYETNLNNSLKMYSNSIDIEINPSNDFFFNFDINNIPNILNICYCDVTDIIDLFNSYEGSILIQKVYSNEITLNIFPIDTTYITEYEKEYLIGHESLLKRKNVNFYQIWHHPEISFQYHLGSKIHEALIPFLKKYKEYTFDYSNKSKHFLTLNNYHTPNREMLFNIYSNLSDIDKNKFICSFRFKNIFLENESENIESIFLNFDIFFGKNLFPHYDSCLIEIISESSNVSVTEKCFKPLIAGIPFIHGIGFEGEMYHNQIEILKSIGMDTCYFGIDYRNENNIKEKIKELLSMSIDEIREKYKEDFEKAELNKIKVFEWIDKITNDIIK
jgi:hypothetical protein